MKPVNYPCRTAAHAMDRRGFVGGLSGGGLLGGLSCLTRGLAADKLQARDMRVLVFNMHGGLSQLESWDPKPGERTGGPCRAIPTSVPGIHVSELLPYTARQMHHLCLLRGVNTSEDDHGKGIYLMLTGRRQSPAADYPQIGAVASKMLSKEDQALPGHILITPGAGGNRGNEAAYLGPRYASIALDGSKPPQYSSKPDGISDEAEMRRHAFRRRVNDEFLNRGRSAITDAYTYSYDQALRLMEKRDVFDLSRESLQDIERYGKHDLGRQCLLARRLLTHGVPFVQVTHSNYDTHNENFNFHLEQLGEFDKPFATLISDLHTLGLLEQTLVVVLSEFGRTPHINQLYGRDHWSKAWTVVMGGAQVARGAVYGKTNAEGTEVTEGQVEHGSLFHTYLQAVGVDSTQSLVIEGRELPLADPAAGPIWDVLV